MAPKIGTSTEQTLLPLIAAGDSRAFSALVRIYVPLLVGYATRLLQSQDMAEDVVQDVLCRVWDQRVSFAQCESVRAYLLRAVRNASLDNIKHLNAEERWEAAYEREDNPPGMSVPSVDMDDALVHGELSQALKIAVEQLPPRRREILLLRLQQLTYAEIAETLSISPKTVEAQVTESFKILKKVLGHWAD